MARNLTIFGPNESPRRDLFFEKFSKGQNEQKYFKKCSENFSKKYLIIFLIQRGLSNRSPGYDTETRWIQQPCDHADFQSTAPTFEQRLSKGHFIV